MAALSMMNVKQNKGVMMMVLMLLLMMIITMSMSALLLSQLRRPQEPRL